MLGKKIRKLLKKNQPNSGFTLTEVLAGLFMSTFVVGALGFALVQILRTTGSEQAKSNARRETSRAIEFISDEVRRARTIELDATNANRPTALTGSQTLVLALDIPEVPAGRVIYYLDTNTANWQGPQVLYRWGPPLDANGNYTNVGTVASWTNEALIDGIDDNVIGASPCTGGDALTPPIASSPSGFYACVNAAQTSAQLYLTGGIDTIANNGTSNDTSYTAATQVVARAKNATVASSIPTATTPIFFRSLGADFICDSSTGSEWTMRMDFANSPFSDPAVDTTVADNSAGADSSRTAANLNSATRWIHDANRKPQPINIDETNDLTIYSVPVTSAGCGSRTENELLAENASLDGILQNNFNLSHTIRFQADVDNRPDGNNSDADFWETFNGNNADPSDAGNYNNPNVTADGRVLVLKNGSTIAAGAAIDTTSDQASAPLYEGFDPDGPGGVAPKPTLGEFLAASVDDNGNSYATLISGSIAGGDAVYQVNLDDDERIIAFEIGQTDNGSDGVDYDGDGDTEQHPGFDVTDNVVLVRSDVFEENHTP